MQGFSVREIENEVAEQITTIVRESLIMCRFYLIPTLTRTLEQNEAILACAVKFEKTRLIDNIIMSTKDERNVSNDDEQ